MKNYYLMVNGVTLDCRIHKCNGECIVAGPRNFGYDCLTYKNDAELFAAVASYANRGYTIFI